MLAALSALQQQPYVHIFGFLIIICNNSLRLRPSLFAKCLREKNMVSKYCQFAYLALEDYILTA
jgi:hypothetical protein